jgi:CBS domain-containing protein
MRVSDLMTASVDSIRVTDTIAHAAERMGEIDVGSLPILSDGKLVGIVTDRDITIRAVAAGIPSDAPVRRIMSDMVETCRPDDDVGSVLALMSREQIRRMPVCDDDREVVGIVALADLAARAPDKTDVADTLADICEPGGLHCQTLHLVERSFEEMVK